MDPYNFDFSNTPAISEMHEDARISWEQYGVTPSDELVPELTPQQQHKLRSNAPALDLGNQRHKFGLKARQYRMKKQARRMQINNQPSDVCDICKQIINVDKKHYHFSCNKRLVIDIYSLTIDGHIRCFSCQSQHPAADGNRTAFVLLDKVFGYDFLIRPELQFDAKGEKFKRHIDYVLTRISSVQDLKETLMAELAGSTKAVDMLIILDWGDAIKHYMTRAAELNLPRKASLDLLREDLLQLQYQVMEGAVPFPRPPVDEEQYGCTNTVWFGIAPMSPESIRWYSNNIRQIPLATPRMDHPPPKLVKSPEIDLHDEIQILNHMLLDMNIGTITRTRIRHYTGSHDFRAPTFHCVGLHGTRLVKDNLAQTAEAKNRELARNNVSPHMRDIRAIKDLKYSSWVNMYQLTATESQKGRYRIEGFFKQFYDHDTRNVLKSTLNNDIPPFRPALTHQVAAESTAFSHEIVQSLASNNNNVPLKAGRLNNILSRYGHGPPIQDSQSLPPPADDHSDPVPHSSTHASLTHQVTKQKTETAALALQ